MTSHPDSPPIMGMAHLRWAQPQARCGGLVRVTETYLGITGRSSVWLEYAVRIGGVEGSNPSGLTTGLATGKTTAYVVRS